MNYDEADYNYDLSERDIYGPFGMDSETGEPRHNPAREIPSEKEKLDAIKKLEQLAKDARAKHDEAHSDWNSAKEMGASDWTVTQHHANAHYYAGMEFAFRRAITVVDKGI